MKRKEVFPDFFILGAQRCGTTSLYAWLNQHSEIFMSYPKEPIFFEAEYEKGLDFYWNKYFSGWKGERLTGDARAYNLPLPFVPERIRAVNPSAFFIVSLRNPVERAFSSWWLHYHRKRSRRKSENLSFNDAIMEEYKKNKNGINFDDMERYVRKCDRNSDIYRMYLYQGYYAEHLERYFNFFPREKFRIFLFEDIIKNPKDVLKDICNFLNISSGECENFDYTAKNVAEPMKLSRATYLFIRNISTHSVKALCDKGLLGIGKRPDIPLYMRKWLIEHYRPHNERLEKILGRSLSHWS